MNLIPLYARAMKVSGVSLKNRDQRYVYDTPVRLETGQRELAQQVTEGTVRDVSLSGVALSINANVENGQFIEMHIEGLGSITGNVARVYEGGAAIAFEDDEDARRRVADAIQRLNQIV